MSWQPIETAPKDGTPIILAGQVDSDNGLIPTVVAGYFYEDGEGWEYPHTHHFAVSTLDDAGIDILTHWMPLPEPPEAP